MHFPGFGVIELFQSTLPVRGATATPSAVMDLSGISIHAPREGSDGGDRYIVTGGKHFNPRSP